MTFRQTSLYLGFAALGVTLLGVCYVLGAWYIGRRWGIRRLLPVWLACSCLAALDGVYRLHRGYVSSGDALPIQTDLRLLGFALIITLCAFGLATLAIRRRLQRAPAGLPTFGGVAAGVGWFFGGLALGLLPLLIFDIRGAVPH